MGLYPSRTVAPAVVKRPLINTRDLTQIQCCISPPISHEELQASSRLDGVAHGDGAIFDARSVDDKQSNNAHFTVMGWDGTRVGQMQEIKRRGRASHVSLVKVETKRMKPQPLTFHCRAYAYVFLVKPADQRTAHNIETEQGTHFSELHMVEPLDGSTALTAIQTCRLTSGPPARRSDLCRC